MSLNTRPLNAAPINGALASVVIIVAFVLSPTVALLAPSLTAITLADSVTSLTLP